MNIFDYTHSQDSNSSLNWTKDESAYHEKITALSRPSLFKGLMVKEGEGLVQANILRIFLEKVKGLLKLGPDWSNKKLIDYHIIQLKTFGTQRKWITKEEWQSLRSLCKGIHRLQLFHLDKDEDLKPFIPHIEHFHKHFPHAEILEVTRSTISLSKPQDPEVILVPKPQSSSLIPSPTFHKQLVIEKEEEKVIPETSLKKELENSPPTIKSWYWRYLNSATSFVNEGFRKTSEFINHGFKFMNASYEKSFLNDAVNGNLNLLKLHLMVIDDINCKDNKGRTALHFAAWAGQAEICEFLVKNNAKIDCKDKERLRPLHLAAHNGHMQLCEVLLDQGADINCKNNNGLTPLYVAARNGNMQLCQLLIDKGADINCKDSNGLTPLGVAANANHFKICELLLENGADVYDFIFLDSIGSKRDNKSNRFFKKLSNKLPIAFLDTVTELRQRKLLAHLSEVKGATNFIYTEEPKKIENIGLEGWMHWNTSYLLKKIVKSFPSFMEEFPDLIDKNTVKFLIESFLKSIESENNKDTNSQFLRWKSGRPVIIKCGYLNHSTSILLWSDQFVHCDLGGERNTQEIFPLITFTFDENLFDKNILEKIKLLSYKTSKEYHEFMYDILPKQLNYSINILNKIIRELPLSWQKVGNCGWASSEGIVLPLLFLLAIVKNKEPDIEKILELAKEQINTFEHWKSFVLIENMIRYMDKAPTRTTFLPDYRPLAKSFAKKFPHHNMDPRLIEKWKQARERFLKIAPNVSKLKYTTEVAEVLVKQPD